VTQREALMRVLLAGGPGPAARAAVGIETLYDLMSDGLVKSGYVEGEGWVVRLTDAGKEALE